MTDITQGIGSEFITVNELAEYLRVTPLWIYNRVRKKEIPHLKIGRILRFRRSTIEEWLKSKEVTDDKE